MLEKDFSENPAQAEWPFEHKLIDLARKPAEFTTLHAGASGAGAGAGAKVPLLQIGPEVVIESIDICRRIAAEWPDRGADLSADERHVGPFIELWTGRVEPAYYGVLSAGDESQARFALSGLVGALAEVEDRLWQRAAEGR